MSRLVVAKGGDPRTLMGLAGIGDLVLTCTGTLSRNYTTGKQLAEGVR
jgi:glycerol-3-phosphate dehydrogenase (NAD(P)+)